MYWSDMIVGSIQRANLDGSGIEILITRLDEPTDIVLTAGSKIYWADSGTGKIQAAGLDGSQIEDILTGCLDQGPSSWTEADPKFTGRNGKPFNGPTSTARRSKLSHQWTAGPL